MRRSTLIQMPAKVLLLRQQGVKVPHLLRLWIAVSVPPQGSSRSCTCASPYIPAGN